MQDFPQYGWSCRQWGGGRHKSIATAQRNILRVKKTSGAVDALDAALADAVES